MDEYRSSLQGRLIPDSEREYYIAINKAYEKAIVLLRKTKGTYTKARLTNLIDTIEKELKAINTDFRTKFKTELPEITHLNLLAKADELGLTMEAVGVASSLYVIPVSTVKQIIKTDNFLFTYLKTDGTVKRSSLDVSSLLINPTTQAVRNLRSSITAGAILGQSPEKIARDIKRDFVTVQKRNVRTVVNTMIGEASARADKQFSADNAEYIKYYLFVATLDRSTSSICRSLDGKKWDEYPPPHLEPKLHPNCRSVISEIPEGYAPTSRPINLMTAADKRKAEKMRLDALKIKDKKKRLEAKAAREKFLKDRIFLSKEPLTFREASELYPPLKNKKTINIDEYSKLLGF